ncbi:MAG: hypothetical protein KJ070_14120 [Verrucomicrobia bacterium]|nr:hypothetical protein [Verrucomicrobiota bacterium]
MKTRSQTTRSNIQPGIALAALLMTALPGFTATSVQFSRDTFLADEFLSPARVAVERTGDSGGSLTVTLTATNGTAMPGEDFVPVSTPITFAPGETNKVVEIQIQDDYFAERDKTVLIQLTNLPAGVTSTRPEATLLIRDDERPGSIDSSWHSTLGLPPLGPDQLADPRIVTRQPDGKLIVNVTVGDSLFFESLFWRIVRINPDGSVDPSFPIIDDQTQSNGEHKVVAMPDGKILVVGYNLPAGGRYTLKYRLNPDGTQDITFTNTLTQFGGLELVPLPDGKVLINGYNWSPLLNGSPIPKLSRLNTDWNLDPTFTGPASLLLSGLWPVSGGKVMAFAYGQSGANPSKLYRLNPDGSLDSGFAVGSAAGTPNMIGSVIEQPDGKLVVGGVFQTFNGQVRNSIVRLNPDGSIDSSFQTGQGFDGQPYQLWPLSGGRILVGEGGGYTRFDGEPVTPPIILNPNGRRDPALEGTLHDGVGWIASASPLYPNDMVAGEVYFATGYGLGRLRMDLSLRIASTRRESDGTMRLVANALPDRSYTLQASENLSHYSDVTTQLATTNRLEFTDPPTNSPTMRFYRLKGN